MMAKFKVELTAPSDGTFTAWVEVEADSQNGAGQRALECMTINWERDGDGHADETQAEVQQVIEVSP
jgi:hypothetical protein